MSSLITTVFAAETATSTISISVVALKSDAAVEKSKDQLSRDFWYRSIFDFCNSICQKAPSPIRLLLRRSGNAATRQDLPPGLPEHARHLPRCERASPRPSRRTRSSAPGIVFNGELGYAGGISEVALRERLSARPTKLDMTRESSLTAKEYPMKSLLLLTASGPLLILTSHESLRDQKLLEGLKHKGIGKFVAFEVPLSLARERYGGHFQAVESNLHETDDLRILDFNGQRVFQLFRFDELGAPILQEQP
jgi:hypothetical protein